MNAVIFHAEKENFESLAYGFNFISRGCMYIEGSSNDRMEYVHFFSGILSKYLCTKSKCFKNFHHSKLYIMYVAYAKDQKGSKFLTTKKFSININGRQYLKENMFYITTQFSHILVCSPKRHLQLVYVRHE